jgi:hypothetical protein
MFSSLSSQCAQKDNVSNQREHLILLLANAESRVGTLCEGTALAYNAKVRGSCLGFLIAISPIQYSLYI